MNKSILDQLDEAEKAATPGPWDNTDMYRQGPYNRICEMGIVSDIYAPSNVEDDESNAELIVIMRNNIRALIDIAIGVGIYKSGNGYYATQLFGSDGVFFAD